MSKARDEAPKRILPVAEARELGERALCAIGFDPQEAGIIADHLIDAALCGYDFAGLPRILTIAEDPRTREPRRPISVVRETGVSLLLDGGNHVGYYAVYRATERAIEKAQRSGVAIVGLHNSYLSGRNAYYLEKIARADLVGIHLASAPPIVLPLGGRRPALGTNPIALGFPSERGPVIFDMGTAAMMRGEVILHSRVNRELPEGVALDASGMPTRVASEALQGGILPFGGHKGYGLSFAIQAMCLLAGAALPRGQVQDYGFLFVVFRPDLLIPAADFKRQVAELISRVKATPLRPGYPEIRIPSERAFRERERRRVQGIPVDTAVYEKLARMGAGGR
jgi:LDH2 family malate/lactate/ureidoglycolate dehydrogenase